MKGWITKLAAAIGLLWAAAGLAAGQIEWRDSMDLVVWSLTALGLGRKLDRVHDASERLYQSRIVQDREWDKDLDQLVREHQENP